MIRHAGPARIRFNGRTRYALASYRTKSGASWFASSLNYLNNSTPAGASNNLDKHNSSHLGTIEAADEDGAIYQAAKQFNITPARRNKIMVTRTQASAPDRSD